MDQCVSGGIIREVRVRLTRREIDSLLRRERGAKAKVAEQAKTFRQNVSRWFSDPRWQHRGIAAEAERHALRIARRDRLSREEVYWDTPAQPERRQPVSEGACVTERRSILA